MASKANADSEDPIEKIRREQIAKMEESLRLEREAAKAADVLAEAELEAKRAAKKNKKGKKSKKQRMLEETLAREKAY